MICRLRNEYGAKGRSCERNLGKSAFPIGGAQYCSHGYLVDRLRCYSSCHRRDKRQRNKTSDDQPFRCLWHDAEVEYFGAYLTKTELSPHIRATRQYFYDRPPISVSKPRAARSLLGPRLGESSTADGRPVISNIVLYSLTYGIHKGPRPRCHPCRQRKEVHRKRLDPVGLRPE